MPERARELEDTLMKKFAHKLAWAVWIVAALTTGTAHAATLYVWPASPNPMSPYDSWDHAATNIQDAVDAAQPGDLVLVTNGVYATGGRAISGTMTNRVFVDQAITVQSINGPEVTVIEGASAFGGGNGDGAIRCAYMGTSSVLSGFTLTNGFTRSIADWREGSGGGAWCENSAVLTNCIITGNSASYGGGGVYSGTYYDCTLTGNSAYYGGGSYYGVFYRCTLTDNSASIGGGAFLAFFHSCALIGNTADYKGGGACGGALDNCTLTGNSALQGGGFSCYTELIPYLLHSGMLYNCTVTGNSANDGGGVYGAATNINCIVYFNTASSGTNFAGELLGYDFYPAIFNYSCTSPMPTNGVGNITSAPWFVNTNGWSDLHLRYGSPGIDAGTDFSGLIATDLDGAPRPLDGDGDGIAAFDMGAYEFDARSIIPSNWFTDHGLDPSDPQVVSGNPDHDPFTTFQEWLADTDPTNALSYFHIEGFSKSSPAMISFQSSFDRTYTLWSTPQLSPPDWTPVPGNQAILGNGGTLILSDTANSPQQFYRVQVNLP